jgi:predicted GH43/DUF377 family glycosyl hydrolase
MLCDRSIHIEDVLMEPVSISISNSSKQQVNITKEKEINENNPLINYLPFSLHPDVRRVLALPFDINIHTKLLPIFEAVQALSEEEVEKQLELVMNDFAGRHRQIRKALEEHYTMATKIVHWPDHLTPSQKLLIGSYCTMEYSFASAALFNPCIVPHYDQSDTPAGSLRFIMSLRAVGEGHISSTVFQTGIIRQDCSIDLDPPGSFSARTRTSPDHEYYKELFHRKLQEMGVHMPTAEVILGKLQERFTHRQLSDAVMAVQQENPELEHLENTTSVILWLGRVNYQLKLSPEDRISDLILFPTSDTEARGIEDLRLVQFHDDGDMRYFGTYTAFDGRHILPMLLETKDFRKIYIHTMNGACVQNKGMALFPRKLDGHFVMCSRIDGRNLYLMMSDYVHFWESAKLLAKPKYPWEFRLIGNCGSPMETSEGWLLITHGVGTMRKYSIGAMLLDHNDPFRIIGRLKEPLITAQGHDREGYVPNVVYSCGSLIHDGKVYLPYAVADSATRMAYVDLDQLLSKIKHDGA